MKITLNEKDAELFKEFQENYEMFSLLCESGVFEQKSATILINFDFSGEIQNIKREDLLYNKKFGIKD